jgi:hypothetical protein
MKWPAERDQLLKAYLQPERNRISYLESAFVID